MVNTTISEMSTSISGGFQISEKVSFDVGFSYCWINLEVLKYSLEQYIGFVGRQAFIHYCGLHQVWLEAEN